MSTEQHRAGRGCLVFFLLVASLCRALKILGEYRQKCSKTRDTAFSVAVAGFLLTVELFYFQWYLGAFCLQLELFCLQLELLFLQLELLCLQWQIRRISTSMDCQQRSSIVSKKAPTVSQKSFPQTSSILCSRANKETAKNTIMMKSNKNNQITPCDMARQGS